MGIRPRYYSDDQEDALIMTTDPLTSPAMVDRVARLRVALDAFPAPSLDPDPLPAGQVAPNEPNPAPAGEGAA